MAGQQVVWANLLRGPSALAVALGAHLIVAVWAGAQFMPVVLGLGPGFAPSQATPQWAEAVLLIDWGAIGVAAFFLVSGLVVPRSVAGLSRRGFLVGRLMRILPTFAAGSALGAAVVLTNHSITGAGTAYSWDQVAVGLVPGLGTVLGITPVPSIEWTLVIEMAFYSLVILFHRRILTIWWTGLAVAAGCILIYQLLTSQPVSDAVPGPLTGVSQLLVLLVPYLPVIMIGVALTASERSAWPRWRLPLVVLLLSGSYLYLASQPTPAVFPPSIANRISYLVVIVAFVIVWRFQPRWKGGGAGRLLSDISYSLYVTHLTLGVTLVLVGLQLGLPPLPVTAGALTVVLFVGWLLHVTVERPTHHLGRGWARQLSPRPAGSDQAPAAADSPGGPATAAIPAAAPSAPEPKPGR